MTFHALIRPVVTWAGVQPRPTVGRMTHAFIGAVLGIMVTGLAMRLWAGGHVLLLGGALPLLVAPIGASAVLLFGVPASPLAQPWAIIGGNTVSALCGILWVKLIGDPAYAAGLAVATAIVMMSLLRCLHPPGGAVALTSVIGGPTILAAGWSFAFVPVAVNCVLLVAIGWLYNTASRGNYPHHARHYTTPAPDRVGYTMADLQSVLDQYDELLDVSSEDLDTLFRQVESRAYRRLHGVIGCDQIMRQAEATIAPDDDVATARIRMAGHASLPVIAPDGCVEGLLTAGQLLQAGEGPVSRLMNPSPCIAPPATAIDELLPILSGGLYHEALVVDGDGRLLGIVTQTDLLGALWRGHIAEEIARNNA